MNEKSKTLNRLGQSHSPYLLQHATNPVNWYSWSDEAFATAEKENKPIFLSIGYSTCHWCHVMEHESFEDAAIAKLMNNAFVCVKVDREEMPEIDNLYMSVCQAMTGRGGWPLTIVMTPDKKPFFAGTYFPKEGRKGQPGMLQLIPSISNAWENKQNEILKSIDQVQNFLISINTNTPGDNWDEDMIHEAFNQLRAQFDHEYGGFGNAPKFPSSHNLIFLVKYSAIYDNPDALTMVERTLKHMRLGGIFDHIGLGFHRYSTDARWFLPHFEKMLYDQAMNSIAYLEAYQITKNKNYANIADEIFSYVLRDMQDQEGGFFSAEDADSEGEEGTFYIWAEQELVDVLGPKNGNIMSKIYGFTKIGNFLDEASGERNGKNIPYLRKEKSLLAKEMDLSLDSINQIIESSRVKLLEKRIHRTHPMKDDKILTDWNGLMIAAIAKGGAVLNNEKYIKAAENAANFIYNNLQKSNGRLMKRYRKGESGLDPHIDDYSFMIWGLISLYESTFNTLYLSRALILSKIMIEDFLDENGGFFIGSKYAEKLMVRTKNSYDGAIPSGNSATVMNFFKLGKITGNPEWTAIANSTLKAFSHKAKKSPTGFTHMLAGFLFDKKDSKVMVIVLDHRLHNRQKIIEKIREKYYPNLTVIIKEITNTNLINNIAPWLDTYSLIENKPTYYLCENFTCKQPTTNLEIALNSLNE